MAKMETSITQMRRTLEQVMASISFQTSGPTGFASCWKQEPMTLEDAHGKLLPLPLELVVSWQMLDSILLGHFRAVIGEKKVQKQEFEIEDSMARSILSRKDPWSQICRYFVRRMMTNPLRYPPRSPNFICAGKDRPRKE
ncbi:hypothetical protein L207DRAFT_197733 [Hyaloscypha variabilis F]|uniref:Ubiquitin-like domain-containing protein n=1 Tax=Hyaloscypha variabilis (strain UAMH 11265 / GT02V1 / F) TaxID=1149755 RepID=A0A2J6QXX9_HYAVF|nr:hypothetical protein L207DRAFT_197733 [Hyaloscypha variabilis F]